MNFVMRGRWKTAFYRQSVYRLPGTPSRAWRDENLSDRCEAHLPRQKIYSMEITMRKTIIFFLGTVLTVGSIAQIARAEEEVRRREEVPAATREPHRAYDQYRGTNDQSND